MFKEGDSNYYTFEGTDEVEYNQPKQLSSKEWLKQENESLSNLRKSTSPARSETKIESQRYSKVDNTFCDNSYTGKTFIKVKLSLYYFRANRK